MKNRKALLSTLWIFAVLNYLYCDILGLMDPVTLNQFLTGDLGFVKVTPEFLLAGSVLMEIPMIMVVLSRVLKYSFNKWLNIIAGSIMTLVQIASLLADKPTIYYLFFSIIEMTTTAFIVWYAWKWPKQKK